MDSAQIRQVRRFNRIVTQRTGALQDSYLRRGRPLGEARLLFQIGVTGADIRTLRERLGFDSGYLSRLLRSLEAQRLIRVHKQVEDGRRRHVRATSKGRREIADELAKSFLAPLSTAQRERLVAAMADVEGLLRAASIEVCPEAPSSAASRWCLAEYFQELSERFEIGFDPAKSNSASDAEMTPPAGFFVVAWLDDRPVGCGALKLGERTTGEIKRMWTAPPSRGLGVARKVLRTLEAMALAAGPKKLRLETNRTLREAQALYRQEGYREVEPFNDEPYADHWFEKQL